MCNRERISHFEIPLCCNNIMAIYCEIFTISAPLMLLKCCKYLWKIMLSSWFSQRNFMTQFGDWENMQILTVFSISSGKLLKMKEFDMMKIIYFKTIKRSMTKISTDRQQFFSTDRQQFFSTDRQQFFSTDRQQFFSRLYMIMTCTWIQSQNNILVYTGVTVSSHMLHWFPLLQRPSVLTGYFDFFFGDVDPCFLTFYNSEIINWNISVLVLIVHVCSM
jgi:hypothetical protein